MSRATASAAVATGGSKSILLTDVSARLRVGCKGPAAEAWLEHHRILVPAGANRFSVDAQGVLVARLATSEFLLESMHGESADLSSAKLALELSEMPSGVYPVLRQDFVIEISGPHVHDLFAQTCAVDLVPVERESSATAGPVIMTSMIGVSIVLACRPTLGGPCFTVWSDPSYSHYFWNELLAIAASSGDGAAPALPTRSGGPFV
jgi:sarcosine oxidase gamma subunit